ncbi:MAG: hypothetical protein LBT32_05290, partial [Peptococcaceae bacterium]|nr:hypothetical protein [Peptococcaceae bacterium]
MSMKERLRRYILFLTGLFFLAGGVVLTLKSALGTTPLATIPYAVHRVSGLSFGLCTFFMSPLFLTCQILLMRREFKKEQWLQLPIGFLLGVFQNIWLFLLQGHLEPSGYLPR